MQTQVTLSASPQALQRIRVVIADPDRHLLAQYRGLAQRGFEVATVQGGLECIERLRDQPPDALVLEPELPWGGGDGVLALMHEEPQLAQVPVMVLSASHDSALINRVARYPIRVFHRKPLSPSQLIRRLHSMLESSSNSANAAIIESSVWRL